MAGFTASVISNTESSEHKRADVCKLKKRQNKTKQNTKNDRTGHNK